MSTTNYYLNKQEQNEVESSVPDTQLNIQMAFKAIVEFVAVGKTPDSKSIYNDAAVALSEHIITICGHKFLRIGFKSIASIHVNDITKIERKREDQIIISAKDGSYSIISSVVTRFSERLMRNYILSNPMMPESFRFPVSTANQLKFPEFSPSLSPFKQFQLTYNASCSYYNEKYYHDIPRYFYNLIRTRNSIFDFTQLPFNLVDSNLGPSTDIRPIAAALQYNHFISGITCHNIIRDDLFTACAPIIRCNTNLKIVRIIYTGAYSGAHDIAVAMRAATKPSVIYWDFSNNQLNDYIDFVTELAIYSAPLVTLIMNQCDLGSDVISTLINSLIHNPATHHIRQLSLLGSTFDETACGIFDQLLGDISADGDSEFIHLELGPVESPKAVIDSLNTHPIDLEVFKIVNTEFDDDSTNSFVDYLKKCRRLRTLDISGCTFTDEQLSSILTAFLSNEKVENVSLALNQLGLNGDRYNKIMPILLEHRYKFIELYLVDNGISLAEPLIDDLGRFRNLTKLSLALNYNRRMTGIGNALTQLLQYYNLKSLDLSGDGMDSIVADALQTEAIPFISELNHNCDLEELNMFGNGLGDDGTDTLVEILRDNHKLTSVNIDGNHPTSLQKIFAYLDVVAHSKTIMNSYFPTQDIYKLMVDVPLNDKEKVLERLARYRLYAQNKMLRNRLKNGIISKLPFVNDKTLDKILDDITLEMNDEFDRINSSTNKYDDVTFNQGLPSPHEDEIDLNPTPQTHSAYQDMMNQKDDLAIKRPDIDKKLKEKGKYLLMRFKIKQLIPPNYSNIDDNNEDSDTDLSFLQKPGAEKESLQQYKSNDGDEEFRPTTEGKLESDSQSKGAKKKVTNTTSKSPVTKKKPVKQSSSDEEYSSGYDESDYDSSSENSESSSSDEKSRSKSKNTGKLSKTLPKTSNKSNQSKKTVTKPTKKSKQDDSSDSSSSYVGSVRGINLNKSKKTAAKKEISTKSQKSITKSQKQPVKKVEEDDEYSDYSDYSDEKPAKKQPQKPKSKSSKQQSSDSESDKKPKSKTIQSKKSTQKSVKKPTKKPSSDSESEYEEDSYEESEEEKPKSTKQEPTQKQPTKKGKTQDKNDQSKTKKTINKKPTKKDSSSEYDYEEEEEEEEEEEDSSESSEEKPIKKKGTGKKETKEPIKKQTKTKRKEYSESTESTESEGKKAKANDEKKQLKNKNEDSSMSSYNTQTDETTAAVTFEATDLTTSFVGKPFETSYSSDLIEKKMRRSARNKKKSQKDGDTVTNEEIITDEFGRRKKVIRKYILIKDDTPKDKSEDQKDDDQEDQKDPQKLSHSKKREKILEEEEKAKKIIASNELTIENLKLQKELEHVKSQKVINYYANIDSALAEEIKALKAKHRFKCQQFQRLYNYDTQRKYETNIEKENEIIIKLNELITNYNEKANPKIEKIGRIKQKPENIDRNSLILVAKNIRELRLATLKEKREIIKSLSAKASEIQSMHFDTQDDIQRIEKEIKMELRRRDEKMYNIYGRVLDREQVKYTEKIEQKDKIKDQSANRGIRVRTYQDRFDSIYIKAGYDMKKNLYISDAYDHYERKLIDEKKHTAKAQYNLRVQTDKLESLKQGAGDFAEIEKRGEVKKVLDEYTTQLDTAKKMILDMREQIARYHRLNKSRDKKSGELHLELQMLYTDEETEDMLIKIKHTIDLLDQLLKGITKIDKKYGGVQNEQIEANERYESMKCTAERMIYGYNQHEIQNAAGNLKKHIPRLMKVHSEYRELLDEMYNEKSVQDEYELIVDNNDETNVFDFVEFEKPTEEEEKEEDVQEQKPPQQ